MNARLFAQVLIRNGYRQVSVDTAGIVPYVKEYRGVRFVVGIVNCMAQCQYSGEQLYSIRNSWSGVFGTANILFVAFSFDSYNVRVALESDTGHWIYDEQQQRLMIFDNQPDIFLNVRQLLEKTERTGYTWNYVFTVNNLVIAANIIVFIIMEIIGDTQNSYFLAMHGGMVSDWVTRDHEFYRIFTAMFMHAGFSHIMGNMVVLFFTGNTLERMVGKWRYMAIYLGSGIVGNIVSIFYYSMIGEGTSVCIGASGAIFGVMGALIVILILNRGKVENLTLTRLLIYLVLNIYIGFTSTGISLSAHLGGLAGGFLLALLLYRKRGSYT